MDENTNVTLTPSIRRIIDTWVSMFDDAKKRSEDNAILITHPAYAEILNIPALSEKLDLDRTEFVEGAIRIYVK